MFLLSLCPCPADLRDDKQFFVDHPGAVPITTAQVKNIIPHIQIFPPRVSEFGFYGCV